MNHRLSRGLVGLTTAALAVSGLALTTPIAAAAPAAAPSAPPTAPAAPRADAGAGLDKADRTLLAEARADGEERVTLLVAADDGKLGAVTERLAGLGGRVQAREAELDYVRVSVPTSQVARASKVSGVAAVDLAEEIPLEDPRPEGTQSPTPQTPPGPRTPKVNPYMPIGETNAAQLTAQRRVWDGRGTTIGIVDSGVDLDHPSLQTTSTGERKILDSRTFTDPENDNDPTWLRMTEQVSGRTFTYDGTTYRAPKAGPFRIATFDERDPRLGGELGNDVNRDGNPAGSSGDFTVIWNQRTGEISVDTDQDADFRDEALLLPYAERFDVDHFGLDNPNTAIREQVPFVVETKDDDWLNIGIVSGAHGSHVAGITAANAMYDGRMSGAAPGAQLKSARVCLFVAGCTNYALIEGMTWLAQNDVDVINMSIGGLPALNDGNNARAVLYNRLVDTYGVQIFISAGNSGAGMNTVGDPSVATKVVSVGSSISDDTWRANYGSDSAFADNLHGFSSRGPREDGGFKPDLVAPGAAVSTVPLWQNPATACISFTCTPGYAMFNGTSMASPQAAGAAALLVGAAKERGLTVDPAQLRQAMKSTTRFFERYGAYEQGTGLVDTTAAWTMLRQGVRPVEITSSVPVSTALSGSLATPGVGVGIHDREGVAPGDTYQRVYTFTRFSGASGTVRYDLEWTGNDGTFTAPARVNLPLAQPVQVPVQVAPRSPGAHSAVLNLDDPTTPGVEYQTMNTVVAADQFTAANSYRVAKSGSIGRNQTQSHFFAVPEGAPAFKVDLEGGGTTQGAGQIRFLRFHPFGVGLDPNTTTQCYNPNAGGGCALGSPTSRTVADPQAGVWEVVVEGRRTSDAASAPYRLAAQVLGATVSPDPLEVQGATAGQAVPAEWQVTSELAPFTGRAVGTTLGSAARGERTIADGASQSYDVQVSPGATSLRATIGNTSDAGADLDLTVLNCTSGTCVQAGQSADGDSEESVTIANPAAGRWTVVVDGYAVPAGTTTYDYVDVFVNPAFGAVTVQDADAERPSGTTWTVPGSVTVQRAPADGRVLLGALEVRTSDGVLVGAGDVVVPTVS